MILTGMEVYSYSLPLAFPLVLKNIRITSRQGLVLRLWDEKGNMGYSEIAPLPGFHSETLRDVENELKEAGEHLPGKKVLQTLHNLDGQFQRWLGKYSLHASTRNGLELAILNLLATSRQLRLAELFAIPSCTEIKLNGLLIDPQQDLFIRAKMLVDSGYDTLKLKVGRDDILSDVEKVKIIREAMGQRVNLRLDANQAWSMEEAVSFARDVSSQGIEYIEEPLQDSSGLGGFYRETGMPVALDESVLNLELPVKTWPEGVKALVLKPALLGGIEKTVQLIRSAQKAGIYAVISSVFESGINLTALAQLAGVFCPPDKTMGLDTWRWLGEDLLSRPFRPEKGRVNIKEVAARAGSVRLEKLKSVFRLN